MARYRKADVEKHGSGWGVPKPAVNVKAYSLGVTAEEVAAQFDCTEEQAGQALEWAFDMESREFWEYWQDTTGGYENGLYGSPEYAYFPGAHPRVWAEGRSDGWLVVEGLPDIETWDAVMLGRWARFEKAIRADVQSRVSRDVLVADIEANEWYKPYSSQYNFSDGPCGTVNLADARADVAAYSKQKYGIVVFA